MNFAEYIDRFQKGYAPDSEEYERRQQLFNNRSALIAKHNCESGESWLAGVNHLMDWSEEELRSLRGYKSGARGSRTPRMGMVPELDAGAANVLNVPAKFTWGKLDAIKEARDQGACGSCWAYAAETVLRAHAEIHKRPTTRFSVSQIVACTPNPNECGGKGGCDGATAELAYEYVLKAGVQSEEDMKAAPGGHQVACPVEARVPIDIGTKPFLTQEGSEEHMIPGNATDMRGSNIGMIGWTKLAENRETPLLRALVDHGPVAVAVAAGNEWNWYWQGIMPSKGCDQSNVISHAVVLFGYGVADSMRMGRVKYWRIKNSWGSGWGESGNLRLQRLDEEEKHCGWDNKPEVGSGCKGGPAKVWVCGSCGILYDAVVPHFQ